MKIMPYVLTTLFSFIIASGVTYVFTEFIKTSIDLKPQYILVVMILIFAGIFIATFHSVKIWFDQKNK
jgi:hypothetical protein